MINVGQYKEGTLLRIRNRNSPPNNKDVMVIVKDGCIKSTADLTGWGGGNPETWKNGHAPEAYQVIAIVGVWDMPDPDKDVKGAISEATHGAYTSEEVLNNLRNQGFDVVLKTT